MRKPIIAGNWKMNKNATEAAEFVEAVKTKIPSSEQVDSVVGATALFLQSLVKASEGTELKIALKIVILKKLEHSQAKTALQL